MNWKTYQIDHAHTVRANCTDTISDEEWTLLGIELCFMAQQHGYRYILLDLSAVTLTFPTARLARLIELYVDYQLPTTTRSAIVLSTKDWPENFSKVVAAAVDQGYSMDLLVGESQVKMWLADAT